jgi:nucleoside-diphosphate-sugar epimerase
MVTGGTGFIGGHTVAALVREGHEPHLLVRDAEKVARICALHGIDSAALSFTVGDILDEASVATALEGCGACVHAAAFTSLDPQEMPKALGVNAPGTRVVLEAAVAAGCDPVVHISSISVIFPPTGDMISAEDPVHEGGEPYAASKAACELYARGLQERGHPVVIVYPSGVLGPRDLGLNVLEAMFSAVLSAPVLLRATTGGWLMLDVRDLASAVAAMIVPARGPRRYVAGGNFLSFDEFAHALERVTGVARPLIDMTDGQLAATVGEEAARMMAGIKPGDDAAIVRDTAVSWRPFTETVADLLAWMDSRIPA